MLITLTSRDFKGHLDSVWVKKYLQEKSSYL